MPDSRCRASATCLHDSAGSREEDDLGYDFEESDPSGRYIRYKEVLGRGAFKTVYRGFDEVDGIEVAWNQVKLQDVLRTAEDLERLYSEVHLLKTLKHRNIIKFYHSWVDTGAKNINFITEIFTSGTLRQYRKRHKHVDIKAVKKWSRQILRGLLYLHSHDPPIIHRDLKCDNIFINGNQGEVKIGDLGLAAILRQAHAAHSVIGTPEFMAPELYEEEYTELADIYSFGMCLLEMVTFEYPYSECNNAAQIYKKVISGQKPAALYKVKDPELRQFVEKCLATASRRLPARELLMDPFLRSDGDRDAVDSGPGSNRMAMDSDDLDRLGVFLSRSFPDASVSHGELELSSNLPDICEASTPPVIHDSANSPLSEYKKLMNQVRVSPTFDVKEDKKGRNMDLRLKGKRRENDTVYLRLRIADSEGQVRIIHFPFDVESDTAMCVASEMVEELDLADQDVTKIAEMIDAAILLMVPEWRPGVAIEEPATDGPSSGGEDSYREPAYSDPCCSHCSSGHFSTMSSENSLMEQLQQGAASWHNFTEVIPPDVTLPQHAENTIHGRFEEVLYHHRRLDSSAHVMKHRTVEAESSKESGGWDCRDVPNFPASRLCKTESRTFYETDLQATYSMETNGNTLRLTSQSHDDSGTRISLLSNDLADVNDKVVDKDLNLEDFLAVADYHAGFDDSDNTDNLVMQELKELALSYERELRELRQKHEAALLALRRRWQDNKAPMQRHQSNMCNGNASCCDCNSQHDKHLKFKQNCLVAQGLSANWGPPPPCLVCVKEQGLSVADARLSKDTCFKRLSRDRGSERNILCNVQDHENTRGEGLLDSSAGVLFLPSRFQKLEQVEI